MIGDDFCTCESTQEGYHHFACLWWGRYFAKLSHHPMIVKAKGGEIIFCNCGWSVGPYSTFKYAESAATEHLVDVVSGDWKATGNVPR